MSHSDDDVISTTSKSTKRAAHQSMTYSAVTARNFRQKRKGEIDGAQEEVDELQRKHTKLNSKLRGIRDEVFTLRENLASISDLLTESDLVQQIDLNVRPCVMQYYLKHLRMPLASSTPNTVSDDTRASQRTRRAPSKYGEISRSHVAAPGTTQSAISTEAATKKKNNGTSSLVTEVPAAAADGIVAGEPFGELVITMQYKVDRSGHYYSQVLPIKWQTKADGGSLTR